MMTQPFEAEEAYRNDKYTDHYNEAIVVVTDNQFHKRIRYN